MRDTSALISAIQENFHTIMAVTGPARQKLIDEIWEYTETIRRVSQAMAEPELAA